MRPRPLRSPRSPLLVTTALVAVAMSATAGAMQPASAQTMACDPAMVQPPSNPLGYRLRGDRCEGVYVQPVSGTALVVASLLEQGDPPDPRAAPDLEVHWAGPASGEIHIRAIALRRRTYYRMDTRRPAASGSYAWPADLMAALDIPGTDLGILASTRQPVGSEERDVHVPLRTGGQGPRDADGPYALVLLPAVALTEVYVSLARVEADGRPGPFLRDEVPLGYNYYPAERPIEVVLERPSAAGLYYLLIGAGMQGGGSLTTEFWFHVPG